MTDEARAAMRAYYKEWRANNKDKVRAKNERYWAKKAAQMKEKEANTEHAETKPAER